MFPLIIIAKDKARLEHLLSLYSNRRIIVINNNKNDSDFILYLRLLESKGIEILTTNQDSVDIELSKIIVEKMFDFDQYEVMLDSDFTPAYIRKPEINNFPFPFTEEQRNVKGLKLHLGCGNLYLNDFINIDLDNDVADENSDVLKLKYKDNSVSLILASHLIEHFAWNDHEKVLREWYRVLLPNCWLILEAPNLEESCKHFLEEQDDGKRIAYVFPQIFGRPDFSRGNIHLSGVWPRYLHTLLGKIGFKEIVNRQPIENEIRTRCLRVDARK